MDAVTTKKHCPCEFLVPLAFNDRTPVPAETIERFLKVLDRQFNGWQELGPRRGSWFGQEEICMAYLVCVPPERVHALRVVVSAMCKELGQTVMYFDQRPPSVEFIGPDLLDEGDAA